MKRLARVSSAALLLALPFAPAALWGQDHDLAGSWVGEIEQAGADPIEIRVDLRQAPTGEWLGTLRMPERLAGATELPRISVGTDGIRFGSPYVPGAPTFAGHLVAEGAPGGARIEGDVELDAPPPAPGTDIYLFALAIDGASWRLGEAVNITDRDGYDNQPHFLPAGGSLLYTSIRGDQADIYRYDVESGRTVQVTATDQSEYSPTPLPSGEGFSTIRVEDDGTQRLWSFGPDGGRPELLLPDLKPVGYQGWLDARRLGLFVLGEPPTLAIAEVGGPPAETVADNVGRSIHVTPDGKAISFVHKASEEEWSIELLDLQSRERQTVIATRSGNEDFIWMPDGRILMGDGSRLFVCSPGDAPPTWKQVADLATGAVAGITRLAMSSDAGYLAVVGERSEGDVAPERNSHRFTLRRSGPP